MTAISLASKLGTNLIINPLMALSQRSLIQTGITTSGYVLDRYRHLLSAGYNMTIERSLDVPIGDMLTQDSYKITNTVAKTAGISDIQSIQQKVEGYNSILLKNKNGFYACHVKTTIAGTYSISFSNNTDRSFTTEVNLLANTWTKIKINIDKIDMAIGTWNFKENTGLVAAIVLTGGSDFHASSLSEWNTFSNSENIECSANQVDFGDNVGAEFLTTQWQFHEGIDEIPFERLFRDFGGEISLCQRYYQIGLAMGLPDGSNAGLRVTQGNFKTEMRIDPSVFASMVHINGGGGNYTINQVTSKYGLLANPNVGSGITATYRYTGQFTADAEL